nr:MAG TPA: hypothetical protein [Caudoviricetes sp.]
MDHELLTWTVKISCVAGVTLTTGFLFNLRVKDRGAKTLVNTVLSKLGMVILAVLMVLGLMVYSAIELPESTKATLAYTIPVAWLVCCGWVVKTRSDNV